jgi:hypothetical protein
MDCTPPIPALDFNSPSFFGIDLPDSFMLPQSNQYAVNLSVDELSLIIAGFLAMTGNEEMTVSILELNAQTYSGLTQDQQIPGLIYTMTQLLTQLESGMPANGAGFVFSGNYNGNPPMFQPWSSGAIAIDSVTRRQFQWNGTEWA